MKKTLKNNIIFILNLLFLLNKLIISTKNKVL